MTKYDIQQTDKIELNTKVDDFSVNAQTLDSAANQKETEWFDPDWTKKVGYWKTIPEFNGPITALSIWTAGKGYTAKPFQKVLLDHIIGWGEDTFTSVMINLIKVKKFAGDSYAEIVRDEGTKILTNIKPWNNGRVKHIIDKTGMIIGYDYLQVTGKFKRFMPNQVLHFCNDRIGDEIHGTGIYEVVKWALDAKHEAMADKRRMLHYSTIRVMEVEEDDKDRYANLKRDFAEAINKGHVLLVPKGTGGIQDFGAVSSEHIEWTRYLENFVYQAIRVPRVIATSENFTESGAKVGFLTFEPIYTNEQIQLEGDLWNQVGIKIKFNRPPSLSTNLQTDEKKDGQEGFQPNDTEAGVGE